MAEIMAAVNSYLLPALAKVSGCPQVITEDSFTGDSAEELACRHDVSPLIVRRYLTGSFWAQFSFSYYAKSMQVISARQWLEAIEKILRIDNFTDLLGLSQGRLDVVARPTFVSKDEAGANIYTSSYRLVYFVEV